MSATSPKLNQRAVTWATLIIGVALVVVWLPHLIWPSTGPLYILPLVLSMPGMIVLLPGLMVASLGRTIIYTVMHHAEIAAKAAMAPNSNDTYFVTYTIGFHLSIPFVCALIVDWILYFLIARQVLKARAQSQAILNPPPSRS